MANKKQTKKSTKTNTKKTANTQKKADPQAPRLNKQGGAVILFAAALLLLCAALIPAPDAALWNALHIGMLGTFGACAYLVPVALGAVAVMMACDMERNAIVKNVWIFSGALVLLEAVLEVFIAAVDQSFWQAVATAFSRGAALFAGGGFNGGALGAIIGYPIEFLLGDIGAKITLLLLLFVIVMLKTGMTLLSLWRPVKKTADFTREKLRNTRDKIENAFDEAQAEVAPVTAKTSKQTARNPRIDIALDEGYPEEEETPAKKAFRQAVENVNEEQDRPQLRIDDIIGRAMDNKEANAPADTEEPQGMTKEELRRAEAEMAKEVEAAEEVKESYTYPPLSLLKRPTPVDDRMAREEMRQNSELLVQTLKEFGISAKVIDICRGPSVTRYELQPNAGVKISRITGLADDIALRLATTGVRIEAPIPNKAAIGIEVPNKVRGSVCLRELIDSDDFSSQQSRLTVALGRDISGQVVTADLASMPHLLIAGTTGSGKSVCTNSMIQSILYNSSPEEVRMILIDPKQVEFSMYNGIPHLLVPVVTNPRKAAGALGWAVTEMLNRYNTFTCTGVRDIKSYNKLAKERDDLPTMPLILIVIDELSDLMMAAGKEVEDAIVRLAQMARAAGMHLVIATQRPSVDVITGLIKANIPSRLALTVASAVDSRTILDTGGADKLLGRGDMLFHPVGMPKPIRVQGCFVSDEEIAAVVEFLKTSSTAQYDEHVVEEIDRQAAANDKAESKGGDVDDEDATDPMLPQAIEAVVEAGQASTSLLQRRLRVGYARAGRLVDEMERRGIIGPHEGAKPRQVLITRQQWLEMQAGQPDSVEG